jgi:hypothetical protein
MERCAEIWVAWRTVETGWGSVQGVETSSCAVAYSTMQWGCSRSLAVGDGGGGLFGFTFSGLRRGFACLIFLILLLLACSTSLRLISYCYCPLCYSLFNSSSGITQLYRYQVRCRRVSQIYLIECGVLLSMLTSTVLARTSRY